MYLLKVNSKVLATTASCFTVNSLMYIAITLTRLSNLLMFNCKMVFIPQLKRYL